MLVGAIDGQLGCEHSAASGTEAGAGEELAE